MVEKISPGTGLKLGTARSACEGLTLRAVGAGCCFWQDADLLLFRL